MMNIHEIEVLIGKDGLVKIHVRGMQGPVCLDTTRELQNALGDILEIELTPEADEIPEPVLNLKQINLRGS